MKRKRTKMNRFNAQTYVAIAAVALGFLASTAVGQSMPDTGAQNSQGAAGIQNSTVGTPAENGTFTTRPAGIDPKAQAVRFLQLGRESLKAGNPQQAAHWAKQAETLAAVYGPGEDTPAQLLADAQLAAQAGGQPVAAPVPATVPAPGPVLAGTAPAVGATAVNMASQQGTVSPKMLGKRNRTIINARLALATGDVKRATALANEAGAMNLPYNVNDDTHENVLAHINNFTETVRRRATEGETAEVKRLMAKSLMDQAQTLLGWGKLDEASKLTVAADQLGVPFTQFETQPKDLLARIENARQQSGAAPMTPATPAVPATAVAQTAPAPTGMGVVPASATGAPNAGVTSADYNPALDTTQNIQVQGTAPAQNSVGYSLLQQAQVAMQQGNTQSALQLVTQAEQYRGELDPVSAQKLSDLQVMLNAPAPNAISAVAPAPVVPAPVVPAAPATAGAQDTEAQRALFGQMVTELDNLVQKTRSLRQEDPYGALKLLTDYQTKVEGSTLADGQKEMILKSLKLKISETETYISDNYAAIELQRGNKKGLEQVKGDVDYQRNRGKQLEELNDEFNTLVREQRFAEAEVVGKKAYELYPEESVAVQMNVMGKMLNRQAQNRQISDEKERGVTNEFLDIERQSIPQTEDIVYSKDWADLSKRRQKYAERQTRYSEKELEIKSKLSTPVQAQFVNQPLQTVMDTLGRYAGINIHLAPDGLEEQGVSPSQMVTLNMTSDISLESALKLILEPLHLDYTIRNEVLLITSQSKKDKDIVTITYPVADLVIPIPNFQTTSSMGLEGALKSAISTANTNANPWAAAMMAPEVVTASRVGNNADTVMNPAAMGQVNVPIGGSGAGNAVVGGGGAGFGTPGASGTAGGASQEDFDKLIELIQETVRPDTWVDNAGEGSIKAFPTNMSLVVSQTQEVHEEVANLLEQLRRLQDLQITIEVRFISLSDSFYEKIGVDFNMNIPTKSGGAFDAATGKPTHSAVVGQSDVIGANEFAPSAMDVAFRQGSSALALPQYGTFDAAANAGASLGFSILSDVEAYLFMEAAQSTERSNVLQAPKVTLFNGQQALVQDVTDTPFVVSVIPVVGDFAAALQPVIVVLSEGSFMTVQAVASSDRRYVRLTVVPFFSQISDVTEFTFTGTTSTTSDTSSSGKDDDKTTSKSNSANRQGTTVQLPCFSYVTVTTTVSVPDGGTILLGGIKRLSEGRNEKGVPILNKIPFINRLFQNTGIGRDTTSLMMMVTPRIIIQEEEEQRMGVAP